MVNLTSLTDDCVDDVCIVEPADLYSNVLRDYDDFARGSWGRTYTLNSCLGTWHV